RAARMRPSRRHPLPAADDRPPAADVCRGVAAQSDRPRRAGGRRVGEVRWTIPPRRTGCSSPPWRTCRSTAGRSPPCVPARAPPALKLVYRTVDAIWYAAGDRPTDFNFYTKRALLAAVYSATTLCWLDDRSPDGSTTEAFLARRLDEAMAIPGIVARLRAAAD